MTTDGNNTQVPEFPHPDIAYADASSIIREIGWVSEQAARRPMGQQLGREFWLRKAAVVDRIALNEAAMYATEDVEATGQIASDSALRLVEYDEQNHNSYGRSGPGSLRFWDPIVGAGYRAYVRQEYLSWSLAEGS